MKIKLRSEAKFDAGVSDDRNLCSCGGGDSAPAAPAAPTSQTVTQTNIPEWARPYAEEVMGKAQALSQSPYQTYTGQRIAGFDPMQQQASQGAANMTVDPTFGDVTQRGMGVQYDPYATGQFTGDMAQSYMNPYMQNVVDIQKREAGRQSAIQGTQQQAEAVQRGAFGGSRDAIMRAERERNLGQQMGDIQAKGLQEAYGMGQQQFNTENQLREQSRQFGTNAGLQGLNTALQGAQSGAQQAQDINKLQQLYGTQQQTREQDVLSQQYQDFLNQQNAPYKQLGFFSDVVRGTGQLSSGTTGSTVYQQPPSLTSQLTGLGTAAMGLIGAGSKLSGSKKGGKISEAKAKKVNKKAGAGLAELALTKMA